MEFWDIKEVIEFTGFSRMKIWRMRRDKTFPEPCNAGQRPILWKKEQIANWYKKFHITKNQARSGNER